MSLAMPESKIICVDPNINLFRYNLDDSSAFSPPSEDDGFFHIPYPKHNKSTSDFASLNEDENKFISITKALNLNSAESSNNNHGFAKHTVPCQKYLGGKSFFLLLILIF